MMTKRGVNLPRPTPPMPNGVAFGNTTNICTAEGNSPAHQMQRDKYREAAAGIVGVWHRIDNSASGSNASTVLGTPRSSITSRMKDSMI